MENVEPTSTMYLGRPRKVLARDVWDPKTFTFTDCDCEQCLCGAKHADAQ